ncbi:hypothetical protein K461DRAFT_316175 [Myriangium duriaei CBS 260.36]|uniref:Uncharacterized protein n=1 Tax=Myriangium duriaei CBS 260.36 TaxID=1168546 RepID=A0A9P4MCL7_9PEZI|nr:hypothetical protein K461DRAFT_316175 [Myriangium duriaei CBS 260.36]
MPTTKADDQKRGRTAGETRRAEHGRPKEGSPPHPSSCTSDHHLPDPSAGGSLFFGQRRSKYQDTTKAARADTADRTQRMAVVSYVQMHDESNATMKEQGWAGLGWHMPDTASEHTPRHAAHPTRRWICDADPAWPNVSRSRSEDKLVRPLTRPDE